MKNKNIQPRLTLVGAGPGDLELITIKGIKAIEKADVILYDALVNIELLEFAPNAKIIFVGKRKGFKAFSQNEINSLIVEEAINNGHVVRLKGGDPFVFGRGFEESEHAKLYNIPVDVVPGISSSIAVPALSGIPVTHRGTSNGFFVLTGTLSDGTLNPEIHLASRTNATVVILMGLSKLDEISNIYKLTGKSNQAFSVISNGSLPSQKAVFGTSATIIKKVKDSNIKSPALIVIGDVVSLPQTTLTNLVNYNLN